MLQPWLRRWWQRWSVGASPTPPRSPLTRFPAPPAPPRSPVTTSRGIPMPPRPPRAFVPAPDALPTAPEAAPVRLARRVETRRGRAWTVARMLSMPAPPAPPVRLPSRLVTSPRPPVKPPAVSLMLLTAPETGAAARRRRQRH
ncbi:hypothetical protein L596_015964 [Steinernema carpocapsae]|uniref:Uncharacterized protein n=1 Tax=Steinernema carpocapsae TaxID=34508 RepID=A0A4U5NGL0_STECR|nr:hypothetical protein L596_015964 [Steinernema carpocapsae]